MAPADANKNIWLAAGDGDLERVKALIEEQGVSPNAADDVIGTLPWGDVNITDEEGDTPLYTAETVAVAQFLVEHGALVDVTNSEGVSPIETTEEDFPEVATYLRSKTSLPPRHQEEQTQAQEHEAASEELTAELIARTQEIITRAEREGRDPHDELTALVGRTVLGGMVWAGERDQEHQEENHDMPER
ncbi:Ankyrin repeats (many copies) [Rhizoctonia solani]|uniref:Ankyrin repeats (Many copies) n=1 Tax=Rhizoctonia solani TaxID=456999 RepID=A0A8H7IBS7_9AGAM|nr:Ankyrin repeats (many copies) [Rhizoctonia solani]